MRLGNAEFPRAAGVFDRAKGRGSGATFVAADQDDICVGFSYAGSHRAYAGFGHQFNTNFRSRIDLLAIRDQLSPLLQRVDIVVGRRRYQSNAGRALAEPGNQLANLMSRQLTAFSRFRPLRHLNLNFFSSGQVGSRHPEPPGSDLLNRAIRPVAIRTPMYSL